MLKLEDI